MSAGSGTPTGEQVPATPTPAPVVDPEAPVTMGQLVEVLNGALAARGIVEAAPAVPGASVALAAPVAPVPVATGLQAELDRWKTRAERSEQVVADMAARPVRSGMAAHGLTRQQIDPGFGAAETWRSLSQRTRDEGYTALPAVIDRAADVLGDENLAKKSTHQLGQLLAQGLNAAEADGLLVQPQVHTTWGAAR